MGGGGWDGGVSSIQFFFKYLFILCKALNINGYDYCTLTTRAHHHAVDTSHGRGRHLM